MTTQTENKDTVQRTYKKLGYTKMETAEIVKNLNTLLANYHVHYQKLRNYHWNVKGEDFFDLHEFFEDNYNEVKLIIDEIAERIRVFGQIPTSTLKEYLETSDIKETGTDLTSMEMIQEILQDYQMLLDHLVNAINAAIDIGDVGTEDLINTYIKNTEKRHWMLNAFTGR